MLISVSGLCDLLDKLGSVIQGNIFSIQCFTLFTTSTALTTFAISFLPISHGFMPLASLCALYGIGYGSQTGNLVLTMIELFGAEHLLTSLGFMFLWAALGLQLQ